MKNVVNKTIVVGKDSTADTTKENIVQHTLAVIKEYFDSKVVDFTLTEKHINQISKTLTVCVYSQDKFYKTINPARSSDDTEYFTVGITLSVNKDKLPDVVWVDINLLIGNKDGSDRGGRNSSFTTNQRVVLDRVKDEISAIS